MEIMQNPGVNSRTLLELGFCIFWCEFKKISNMTKNLNVQSWNYLQNCTYEQWSEGFVY